MAYYRDHKEVNFLDLNTGARADALTQIAKIHEQKKIYNASISEDSANMIVMVQKCFQMQETSGSSLI